MKTNKDRLAQALRHVHFAQGHLQALNTRTLTERQALDALDRAEIAILDLKGEDAFPSHDVQ